MPEETTGSDEPRRDDVMYGGALGGGSALAGCTGEAGSAPTEEFERRMGATRENPVGQQLAAVRNDRLSRGGTSYQGPVISLFQTEAAAKQFYPDTFGEWHGSETLSNEDERLFDYQRAADVINGEF